MLRRRRNGRRTRGGITFDPPPPLRLAPPPAVAEELHRVARSAADQRTAVATMPTGLLVDELERRGTKRSLAGHLAPEDRVRLQRLLDQALMLLGEQERTCHRCGCTAERACAGSCRWVGPDLCSACADPAFAAALDLADIQEQLQSLASQIVGVSEQVDLVDDALARALAAKAGG